MTTISARRRTVFREVMPADAVDDATLDRSIDLARNALLGKQHADGYWCAELQGDSILESEYLLLKFILGQEGEPANVKIANELRALQDAHGGWSLYPGGPPDISGTAKAYFALKLMGDPIDAPHMRRARDVVLSLGGAERCNTFSTFYFAALGQISYDACPSIPPEIVFFPKSVYFNLHNVSAWTRTMILPLGIVTTLRYTRKLRADQRIDELYRDLAAGNRLADPIRGLPQSWRDAFLKLDTFIKRYERRAPLKPLRQRAIRKAERWILERLEGSEGLGAIFPPMVYLLIAFRALGYADDHPVIVQAQRDLRDFFIEEGDRIRIQPCFSPVWDTGIALHALAESGVTSADEPANRATRWLLGKECRVRGDWAENVAPGVEPGGWFFEFANPFYPDTDDTAMVSMSLRRLGGEVARPTIDRALKWLMAMQNDDGGWAAFDKTTDRPILETIPFADHNAMQDPSCPDITGRILEGLGHNGFTVANPNIARAVAYIRSQQDASGAWWGRWGVNFIYGTWQVLVGLRAVGADMNAGWVQRGAAWLRSVQKPDGSFGETCASYDDPSLKGRGESTPSQTAWGAMGLMAAGGAAAPGVAEAIGWLTKAQRSDGNFDEPQCTGTGFPKVFYLRYHLYRLYFPLMAMARYRRSRSA